MFNSGFYPSPERVRQLLLEDMGLRGSRVLEPSAGKGDLADAVIALNSHYAQNTVDVIELEPDLCSILQGKGYSLVGQDFLSYQSFTEYDAIIMNPPFDNGDKHLLHAIKSAENQVFKSCKISCIMNAETVKNPYSATRKELQSLLNRYGADTKFYEGLFKEAERSTNVETVIIKLTVDPVKRKVSNVYSEMLSSLETDDSSQLENSLSTFVQSQELQERVSDIKTLVKQYEYHVQLLRKRYESDKAVKYLEELMRLGFNSEISQLPDINSDIERIRCQYWQAILKTEDFAKKLTQHGRQQLQKQISASASLEINLTNIQMLLMAVAQNSGNILLDSCINLFERITKHHQNSFSSNIHYYSGWKSNDAYKVNRKFILPFGGLWGPFSGSDMGYQYYNYSADSELRFEWVESSVKEFVQDLIKMLQLIDPSVSSEFSTVKLGEFENETVRFKMFGKGTVHFWIKDLELLEKFNVLCGQHFNWIPQDEEIRSNPEAKQYMQQEFKQYLKIKQLE